MAAGWITAADHTEVQISRRRWVTVALYRISDVDALLELHGVDWEQVRAARPGEPSPLREYAALPTARGTLIKGFAADLADRYGVPVTAVYHDRDDRWELAWTPDANNAPDTATVRAALSADRDLAPHARHITLQPTDQEDTNA